MNYSAPEDRIISPKAVFQKTSLSKTTIWRMTRKDEFPKPIRLSANRIGWSQRAVDAWIAARAGDVREAA
jgi:prophage regulatory protein